MEKGRVRSLDSTICIKQCLIQRQLAPQRVQGCRNLLILPQIIGGFFFPLLLPTSHRTAATAAVGCVRFVTGVISAWVAKWSVTLYILKRFVIFSSTQMFWMVFLRRHEFGRGGGGLQSSKKTCYQRIQTSGAISCRSTWNSLKLSSPKGLMCVCVNTNECMHDVCKCTIDFGFMYWGKWALHTTVNPRGC